MTDRAQLVVDVDEWLARDDVSSGSNFDSILRMAEARIARHIRTLIQQMYVQISFDAREENLPSDFLELRAEPTLADAPNPAASKIYYQTPDVLRGDEAYQNASRTIFYSIESDGTNHIMLISPPGSASTPTLVDVQYIARFPALVNPTDTNWLLTNHYDIYLFATLHQAAVYLQEEQLKISYATDYGAAKDELARSENRKRWRMGTPVARGRVRANP